jgi:hypothetical protein
MGADSLTLVSFYQVASKTNAILPLTTKVAGVIHGLYMQDQEYSRLLLYHDWQSANLGSESVFIVSFTEPQSCFCTRRSCSTSLRMVLLSFDIHTINHPSALLSLKACPYSKFHY